MEHSEGAVLRSGCAAPLRKPNYNAALYLLRIYSAARDANCPGFSEAALDSSYLALCYIGRDLDFAFKGSFVTRTTIVGGIAARGFRAGGIPVGRGLDDDIRPRNAVLLDKMLNGKVCRLARFERCADGGVAFVGHRACLLIQIDRIQTPRWPGGFSNDPN
jgi:hypothetical protein